MPKSDQEYPTKYEMINYLSAYENKFDLNIERPINIISINKIGNNFLLIADNKKSYWTKNVILATGATSTANKPELDGIENFQNTVIHSSEYRSSKDFIGKSVLVVGGGNSAAQIYADLIDKSYVVWSVKEEPKFLPDNVDGRYLFDKASDYYKEILKGNERSFHSLGNIVIVESVAKIKKANKLKWVSLPKTFSSNSALWDNRKQKFDAVILATGFKSDFSILNGLDAISNHKRFTLNTNFESKDIEGLFFAGYGNWTGFASATVAGIGRYARIIVSKISANKKITLNTQI